MKLTPQDAGAEQGRPMLEFRDGTTNELQKIVLPGGNGYAIEEIVPTGTPEEKEAQLAALKAARGY